MQLLGRDMTTGTTVSAVGHVTFVAWLLTGWGLSHEPLPFEVTQVSVVSGAEYAQIVAATTPQPLTEIGAAPEAPVIAETPPILEPVEDTTPPVAEAAPEAPAEETPPAPVEEPVPEPTEVTEEVAEIVQPLPEAPPPAPDLEVALRPVPRPSDRVAPEAVAAPEPDVDVAPEVTEEATPEAQTPEIVEEEADAAAPEEASTEIVTEAEAPSGAVEVAERPPTRPDRPAPVEEVPEEAEVATATSEDVEDTLAAALAAEAAGTASAGSPAVTEGPPLTGAEQESFRLAVQGCWSVDIGSEASRVIVTVGFNLDRDGRVVGDVRLIGAGGGSGAIVDAAFAAARRAVLRCQSSTGYQLPDDKYDQWDDVEMTFDPSNMRG